MAEQEQAATGWISTAERLPERDQYVNFVAEGGEEVLVGKFWGTAEDGYFQDILDYQYSGRAVRWKPIDLSPREVVELMSNYDKHRQEIRALLDRADTIENAQLNDRLSDRMQSIKRKLGGTTDDS